MDLKDFKEFAYSTPEKYSPSIKFDEKSGLGCVTAPARSATDCSEPSQDEWCEVITSMGLDASKYEIVSGSVRVAVWDSFQGPMHSYRAQIRIKPERCIDVDAAIEKLWESKPSIPVPEAAGHRVIFLTDTHIGKSEVDGAGSELLIERWKTGVTASLEDGKHLPFESVTIALGGDLVEGYVSQNGKNISGCDLSLTDQIRVATNLVTWTIREAVQVSERVQVVVVPGNHGDVTRVQNVVMRDSIDVQITSAAQLACETAGYSTVSFLYPEEQYADVSFFVGDDRVTMVHGHTFSGKPMAGAEKWWSGQIMNGRVPTHSSILLCGHFHTAQVQNWTSNRWIIFGAALETESTWFANQNGSTGRSGVLYFDVEDGEPQNICVK